MTFDQIETAGREQWLARLGKELRDKTYKPDPVRRVMIPKPGGNGERPLGIPTIRDRVAQTAAVLVLEPIFEADFLDEAYGYRPKRSAADAVKAVHQSLKEGYTDVVDADLSKYFDTIPHRELMKSVARRIVDRQMLRLIRMWLKVPVEERDERGNKRMSGGRRSKAGTPQGGVITPPTIVQNAPVGASVKRADVHPVHHFHLLRLDLHAPHQRPDHFPARLPVSVVQTGRELPRERFKIVNHEAQLLGLRLPVEVRL